jgi:hypothetical protein
MKEKTLFQIYAESDPLSGLGFLSDNRILDILRRNKWLLLEDELHVRALPHCGVLYYHPFLPSFVLSC